MTGLSLAYSAEPNIAPAQPLARSKQQRAQDKTAQVGPDWFVKAKQQYLAENESTWQAQALLWEMIYLFVEGKQLLKRSRYTAGWRAAPMPERTDSPVFSQNITGFLAENIKAKWTQSNTGINWRATSDTDQMIGASKAAGHVEEYYARKLYTERFRQTESTLALCGKYARYYYYSEEQKAYGRRPKIEKQQLQFGDGSWFCADCGAGGAGNQLGGTGANAGMASSGRPDQAGLPGASAASAIPQVAGQSTFGRRTKTTSAGQTIPDVQRAAIGPQFGHDELVEQQQGLEAPHAPEEEGYEPDEATHLGYSAQDQRGAGVGIQPDGAADYRGLDRGSNGELPQSNACPACGSPNLDIQPPAQTEIEAVAGYEEVELDDLVCESVPAFELKHDLTKTPQDSPYLIRRRRIRVALLESKFEDLDIKAARREDPGLQAEDDLKRSAYTSVQSGLRLSGESTQGEPTADFIQVWLDPCLYSRNVLKEDFQTVTGQMIPAGTKLVDLFPDGMYSAWIEGIEGCVELRNEHHSDYFVGSEYRVRAISSLGSGIEDIIEGQRQYNLIQSIIYTQLRTSAMPATLYDQRLLPNGTSSYLGSLQNIPVEMAALDDRVPISAAVHQLSPQPPTEAHFQYGHDLDNFMQKASRVIDIGFGEAIGRDNKTLGGAQLAAAQSQGLFGPQLALKAEVDRRGAEIKLALFKKYGIDERYISLSGKRGEQDGVWLSAADIPVDLYAEIAGESYLPQTNLERQQRWQNFLALFPNGMLGLAIALQEKPAFVEQLAEIYDVDLGDEDYSQAAELFQERLQQMKQALPMLQVMAQQMPPTQMQVDPMSGQAVEVPVDPMAEAGQFLVGILDPPIEMEEMGQLPSLLRAQSWLTEDEGKKAPKELRAGVKAMMPVYINGIMMQAQIKMQIGMASQPPQPMEQGEQPQGGSGHPPDKSKPHPRKEAQQKALQSEM